MIEQKFFNSGETKAVPSEWKLDTIVLEVLIKTLNCILKEDLNEQ